MKGDKLKRLLFISLALALALTALAPATVSADKDEQLVPFNATGDITGITSGTAFPAGNSGWWRVVERQIFGTVSGDIAGDFTMTYKGVFKLATQEGNLNGMLMVEGDRSYVLKVNGKSEPLEFVPAQTPYGIISLPRLTIHGHWTFTEEAPGNGNFDAWVIFIPANGGHVGDIIASAFTMTGHYGTDDGEDDEDGGS